MRVPSENFSVLSEESNGAQHLTLDGWLDARGREVAFGTGDGEVYRSDDAGERWTRAATGLPSIRGVRFA